VGRKGEGAKLHVVDEQDDVIYLAEVIQPSRDTTRGRAPFKEIG